MSVALDGPAVRGEAVRPVTITELEQARHGTPDAHGLAVLTATVDGWIMAVCTCSLVGYGVSEGEARKNLTQGHR